MAVPNLQLQKRWGDLAPSVMAAQQRAQQTGGSVWTGTPTPPAPRVIQQAGGGGGQAPAPAPAPATTAAPQPPMESKPAMPSIDWDAMFAPALEAYDKLAATMQPQYETTVKEIGAGGEQQVGEVRGEEERRMSALGQQRTRETRRGESAIAEARRQAAEMQRGIQARFGGLTGTGKFASEILGAQAMRNIGQARAVMQETMGQIGQAEENLRSETTRLINNINENVSLAKERARHYLDQQLAQIAVSKGELEARKAERRIEVLQNYQAQVQDVEARNTQFRQQLFQDAQRAQQEIDALKQRTQLTYSGTYGEPSYSGVTEYSETGEPITAPNRGIYEDEEEWS